MHLWTSSSAHILHRDQVLTTSPISGLIPILVRGEASNTTEHILRCDHERVTSRAVWGDVQGRRETRDVGPGILQQLPATMTV